MGTMMGYAPQAGLSSMLKDGSKHLSGLEEAILRNIDACKQLKNILCTSMGPNGMNKMVQSYMGKLFVTSDAATIVRELEIIHPAAKMLVLASDSQEQECGDGTALVVVIAGELLEKAESLIYDGLHPSDIIEGYEVAAAELLRLLPKLVCYTLTDIKDKKEVANALKPCVASKLFGLENTIAPLVADACVSVLPANVDMFSVENVRVTKILGGSVSDSTVVRGAVLSNDTEGTIKHCKDAKVAVFTSDFESNQAETKGTVLLSSADELMRYNLGEEAALEKRVRELHDAGVNVVVSTKFGEVAMHFLEEYRIMAVKCPSKIEMRRVARTTRAIALPRLRTPTAEELGRCDEVNVEEIGSTRCTVFRQALEGSRVCTLVVRASTQTVLDDVERAIDDAVHVYRGIAQDPRFVPGGGATEMELSRLLEKLGDKSPGLDQYAIKKFAEALHIVPRVLGDNAGHNTTNLLSSLMAAHASGETAAGVDIDGGGVVNAMERSIIDLMHTKLWALKFASDAVLTVLRVDQIIMSKPAGGPKPRDMAGPDATDDE